MALDTSPGSRQVVGDSSVPIRDVPRAGTGWLRHPGSRWALPGLLYLAVRGIGLLVLVWTAAENDEGVLDTLTSWDGLWFLGIAEGGYDGVPADLTDNFGERDEYTTLAFFPGYPGMIAVFDAVPGVAPRGAAITVSVLSGLALAYGLMRLAALTPVGARLPTGATVEEDSAAWRYRLGLILVVLVGAAPMAGTFLMAYTEALFCAFAVWTLALLLGRRWILAGLCCASAGLVRPTGAALVVAVVLAAAVALYSRRDGIRPLVGALIAPAGLLGYLGYVAGRTGDWNGWFEVQQRGWDTEFDGGASTWRYTGEALRVSPTILDAGTVLVLAGALVALVVCVARWARTGAWPLLVYTGIVVVMDVGADGLMNSKARLMLPAFVLLVPVAIGLARRRPSTIAATLIAVTLVSAWFSAYALVVYPYAI